MSSPLQSRAMSGFPVTPEQTLRVLFVCTGNICRSPTAEGVLLAQAAKRGLDARVDTDSAGTHSFGHQHPPDERAQAAAAKRDIEIAHLRSRQFEVGDFARFDLILVADHFHIEYAEQIRPAGSMTPVMRILDFLPADGPLASIDDIPDPYGGGQSGFERVLDLLTPACEGLLDAWQQGRLPPAA